MSSTAMSRALALELERKLSRSTCSRSTSTSTLDTVSSASSCYSPYSESEFSSPATSASTTPSPSRKCSYNFDISRTIPEEELLEPFPFLSLPSEIRSKIYHLALDNTTIHLCSPTLKRRRGGPNRTTLVRRLPGILSVNKQIRKESHPLLAHHATLAFSDFFNFSHLLTLIPESFSCLARKISLKGDVIVTPELLSRFPALEHVLYTQLGNCPLAPTRENGFITHASEATNTELVESVKERSASLMLLKEMIWRVNDQRREEGKELGDIQLEAVANVLSSRQRVVSPSTHFQHPTQLLTTATEPHTQPQPAPSPQPRSRW